MRKPSLFHEGGLPDHMCRRYIPEVPSPVRYRSACVAPNVEGETVREGPLPAEDPCYHPARVIVERYDVQVPGDVHKTRRVFFSDRPWQVHRFLIGDMHIHADFGDEDTRIRAMTAIRRHLPPLHTLSASSPFTEPNHPAFRLGTFASALGYYSPGTDTPCF